MRIFGVILLLEDDGSIKTCHLEVYENGEKKEKQGRILLGNLSKRELDNLGWMIEDVRKNIVYGHGPSSSRSFHVKIERKQQ